MTKSRTKDFLYVAITFLAVVAMLIIVISIDSWSMWALACLAVVLWLSLFLMVILQRPKGKLIVPDRFERTHETGANVIFDQDDFKENA